MTAPYQPPLNWTPPSTPAAEKLRAELRECRTIGRQARHTERVPTLDELRAERHPVGGLDRELSWRRRSA